MAKEEKEQISKPSYGPIPCPNSRCKNVSDESREKHSNEKHPFGDFSEGLSVAVVSGRWSFRGCVLYRKTLSEIYGEIIRDGVSESKQAAILRSDNYANFDCREINGRRRRPLSSVYSLGSRRPDVPSAFGRPCIIHQTCNYCGLRADLFLSVPRASFSSRLIL